MLKYQYRSENEDFVGMDSFCDRICIHSDKDYYNIIGKGISKPKAFVERELSKKCIILPLINLQNCLV